MVATMFHVDRAVSLTVCGLAACGFAWLLVVERRACRGRSSSSYSVQQPHSHSSTAQRVLHPLCLYGSIAYTALMVDHLGVFGVWPVWVRLPLEWHAVLVLVYIGGVLAYRSLELAYLTHAHMVGEPLPRSIAVAFVTLGVILAVSNHALAIWAAVTNNEYWLWMGTAWFGAAILLAGLTVLFFLARLSRSMSQAIRMLPMHRVVAAGVTAATTATATAAADPGSSSSTSSSSGGSASFAITERSQRQLRDMRCLMAVMGVAGVLGCAVEVIRTAELLAGGNPAPVYAADPGRWQPSDSTRNAVVCVFIASLCVKELVAVCTRASTSTRAHHAHAHAWLPPHQQQQQQQRQKHQQRARSHDSSFDDEYLQSFVDRGDVLAEPLADHDDDLLSV